MTKNFNVKRGSLSLSKDIEEVTKKVNEAILNNARELHIPLIYIKDGKIVKEHL